MMQKHFTGNEAQGTHSWVFLFPAKPSRSGFLFPGLTEGTASSKMRRGNSLVVHWLGLCTSTAPFTHPLEPVPTSSACVPVTLCPLCSSPTVSSEFHPSVFRSVAQLCLTLCNPMDCSTPGFPVHHQFTELTQSHVPRVSDAIQPPHPLLSPSPPAFNLSQHQGLFQGVSSSS